VHLFALAHDDEEAARDPDLVSLVTSWDIVRVPWLANRLKALAALAGQTPLTHVLLDSAAVRPALERAVSMFRPDLVFAYCSGMARFALERPLSTLPLLLDMVDLDSEKWRELAARNGAPLRWIYAREARVLGEFETQAIRVARHTLVVNERERISAVGLVPDGRVVVVPNGIDVDYFRPTTEPSRRPEAVFAGVFDYAPNAAGARWLLKEVWPRVRARRPDAALTFVGSRPSGELREAAATDRSITVTGAVADVRPWLWRGAVSAAPIFVARGLQNKVLEAMAAGLPVVTTPAVAAGLPSSVSACCRIAETPDAFADALLDHLTVPTANNYDGVLEPFKWESSLAGLDPLLASHAPAVKDRMGRTVT
jgi:sugar transferase (PEP-CTERM/EpsH1 system associated)